MDAGRRLQSGGLRLLPDPQRNREGRLQLRRISPRQRLSRRAPCSPRLEGYAEAPRPLKRASKSEEGRTGLRLVFNSSVRRTRAGFARAARSMKALCRGEAAQLEAAAGRQRWWATSFT